MFFLSSDRGEKISKILPREAHLSYTVSNKDKIKPPIVSKRFNLSGYAKHLTGGKLFK